MICASRRQARSPPFPIAVTSRSSKVTSPLVGSIKRRMQRPVVDLPQPDSPTSPNVSPRKISNVTLSTARSGPSSVGKCLTSDCTETSLLWFSVVTCDRFRFTTEDTEKNYRQCLSYFGYWFSLQSGTGVPPVKNHAQDARATSN